MNTIYNPEGQAVNFDFAVMMMDDELREEIHAEFAPCSDQKFFDEYCMAHLVKYGEEFTL